MRTALVCLVVVLLVALAMALTCPDRESFAEHVARVSTDDHSGLIDRAAGAIVATQARLSAEVCDYRLFAVGETTRGDRHETYLGLLGTWFRIAVSDDD